MINNVYTIFDTVAGDSSPFFQAANDKVALRQFKEVMKSTTVPEDFQLWCLGKYDTQKMTITLKSYLVQTPESDEQISKLMEVKNGK